MPPNSGVHTKQPEMKHHGGGGGRVAVVRVQKGEDEFPSRREAPKRWFGWGKRVGGGRLQERGGNKEGLPGTQKGQRR